MDLRIARPHHPGKLSDELIAALPQLVRTLPNGRREARFGLSSDGATIFVRLDEDLDGLAPQITAVVNAHDSTPPPPPPDPLAGIESASTLNQLRTALVAYLRSR